MRDYLYFIPKKEMLDIVLRLYFFEDHTYG